MDPNVLFETIRLMGFPVAAIILLAWQHVKQMQNRAMVDQLRESELRVDHWREMAERSLDLKVPRRPQPSDTVDAVGSVHVSRPLRPPATTGKSGPPFKPPAAAPVESFDDMPSQGTVRGPVPMLPVEWETLYGRKTCLAWLRERRRNARPPAPPPPPPDFNINTDVRFMIAQPSNVIPPLGPEHHISKMSRRPSPSFRPNHRLSNRHLM